MKAPTGSWPWSIVMGALAAGFSLFRLWLGNPLTITQNLWAEDGLFPLCIHKADLWECTAQPFAGYLLFVPRVLAWPTSMLSWEQWALSANVIAALLAAGATALVVVIVRGAGLNWFVSSAIALLPVISPIVGLEVINTIGSSYMLLLFVSTLALVFAPARGRVWTFGIGALILVTALTIPSAVVLLAVLAVQWARRVISHSAGLLWSVALVAGLISQTIVAITAEAQRPILLSVESIDNWADSVPVSILTFWPGLSFGEFSFFVNFTLAPISVTGWLFVILLSGLGAWRLVVGWKLLASYDASVGLLFLAGLAFGFIPSAIGFSSNRYFVVPVLLWATAVLAWIAPAVGRTRPWIRVLVTAIVVTVWWPAIPASPWRTETYPMWQSEVERLNEVCTADPALSDRVYFSPYWPPEGGDGLMLEPTNPSFPCPLVYRWLS